ncbi:MAG TPA: FimV/HubP family polar landmark protein [Rhodanobacter sp.]|jgi:pilus assembly protein FimV|nr:FimV/HubP family polar landmark protein [Rhodanobacter sp.]
MNRSLKLSMLMALALGTNQAIALDLGQIQVKSALGQPLLAEIPVHPASPAELQNLTVQLASSEEFARAGIVGGRTAIPLHFSVANGAGGKVIRITSSQSVDDPYLDLLLEVSSSAGKSVREFAILLDPASAPAAAPAAVAAAPEQTAAPSRPARAKAASAAAPAQAHVAAAAPKAAPAAAGNGQYGPVERGQTLSSIARATAPAGTDAQQMMLALKQANPDAFYRDNINALKSGAVLRVPTSAEAQAMTIAAAVAEVRRQNSDWRAGTPGKPAVVADAATRASTSSALKTSSDTGDRLALVPAKEGNRAGVQGTGKDDKSAAGIRQDLLRSQESLVSLQQQSTDLKTRLKDLADINSKNERLLSLKDNEIAELQAKLAAARKSAGLPAAAQATAAVPAPAASVAKTAVTTAPQEHLETASTVAKASSTPAAAGSSAVTTMPLVAAASTSTSASATSAAVTPTPVKPVAKPVIKPGPAPVVEEPWYMQTWAWAAGAGAVVLLLLLGLFGRGRKSAVAPLSKSASSLADRFGSNAPAGDDTLGGDVDQEELLDQLAEHPDDIGLHLELVTLYYSRRDVDHFEAAAEAMHAHITDPQQDEWQDVMHMGEDLVPGHPLFDHHPELPMHEETEARREFDIDDYAHGSTASTVVPSSMPPLPSGAPKKVSEYNFNFDLTRPTVAESATDHSSVADAAMEAAPPAADTHAPVAEAASSWRFGESDNAHQASDHGHDMGEFNDDPVDTKLDLARAYLDMGDADGARAMLGEVMKEGSQMQRDTAKRLLEGLH